MQQACSLEVGIQGSCRTASIEMCLQLASLCCTWLILGSAVTSELEYNLKCYELFAKACKAVCRTHDVQPRPADCRQGVKSQLLCTGVQPQQPAMQASANGLDAPCC